MYHDTVTRFRSPLSPLPPQSFVLSAEMSQSVVKPSSEVNTNDVITDDVTKNDDVITDDVAKNDDVITDDVIKANDDVVPNEREEVRGDMWWNECV